MYVGGLRLRVLLTVFDLTLPFFCDSVEEYIRYVGGGLRLSSNFIKGERCLCWGRGGQLTCKAVTSEAIKRAPGTNSLSLSSLYPCLCFSVNSVMEPSSVSRL